MNWPRHRGSEIVDGHMASDHVHMYFDSAEICGFRGDRVSQVARVPLRLLSNLVVFRGILVVSGFGVVDMSLRRSDSS